MLAFVLGGGGTKGAAQAGAIRALLERDIVPDMLVGTSAGAINAAHIARVPTLEGAGQLENAWRALTSDVIFSSRRPWAAWRTVRRRPSLYASDKLRDFLTENGPPFDTFASVEKELYIVASQLRTGRAYVFGDRPTDNVLDAVMASTAIPPIFPPVKYKGTWLVDGGVSANLPLQIAIQRGATEIYALDISSLPPTTLNDMPVWMVTELSVGAMVRQQMRDEIAWARLQPGVTLHYMRIPFAHATSTWDVDAIEEHLELGYSWTNVILSRRALPQPERSFLRSIWHALGFLRRGVNAIARGIVSGVEFVVRLLWRRGQTDLINEAPVGGDGTHDDEV